MKNLVGCSFILGCCLWAGLASAQTVCQARSEFVETGWRQPAVQEAMDHYLRQHRMRANWLREPVPPDQIGRDYYEWLWHSEFGAGMKRELVQRFCGAPEVAHQPEANVFSTVP